MEYLTVMCHPYYLLQELTLTILTVVYISPTADAKLALEELHNVINSCETKYPEALFIIAGDFKSGQPLEHAAKIPSAHPLLKTRGQKHPHTLLHNHQNRILFHSQTAFW